MKWKETWKLERCERSIKEELTMKLGKRKSVLSVNLIWSLCLRFIQGNSASEAIGEIMCQKYGLIDTVKLESIMFRRSDSCTGSGTAITVQLTWYKSISPSSIRQRSTEYALGYL